MSYKKIIQIIPCTFPMFACYYLKETNEIMRKKIPIIAIVSDAEEMEDGSWDDTYCYIVPCTVFRDGIELEYGETVNFLGFEEEEEEDWAEEIERAIRREKSCRSQAHRGKARHHPRRPRQRPENVAY